MQTRCWWNGRARRSAPAAGSGCGSGCGRGREPSAWSPLTRAETGLLARADWTARPVTPDRERADAPLPVALLHRTFTLGKAVASARLYITAYGVYEAEINGTQWATTFSPPAERRITTVCATRPST